MVSPDDFLTEGFEILLHRKLTEREKALSRRFVQGMRDRAGSDVAFLAFFMQVIGTETPGDGRETAESLAFTALLLVSFKKIIEEGAPPEVLGRAVFDVVDKHMKGKEEERITEEDFS